MTDGTTSIYGPRGRSAAAAPAAGVLTHLPLGLRAGPHHQQKAGCGPTAAGAAVGCVCGGPPGSVVGGIIGHFFGKWHSDRRSEEQHTVWLPATDAVFSAVGPPVKVRLWCAGIDAPLTDLGWQLVRTDTMPSQMDRFMGRVVRQMGGSVRDAKKWRNNMLPRCRAGQTSIFSGMTGRPFKDLEGAVAELGRTPEAFGVSFTDKRW